MPSIRSTIALLSATLALALLPAPVAAQGESQPHAPAGAAAHPAGTTGDGHAADDQHADGAHHEAPGVLPTPKQALAPLITAWVVFGIVMFVLSTKVWPKISKGLSDRENKIREEIAAAEAARQQAKDALEQYELSLAQARGEAQKMLEQARAQQQQLAAQLRAQADVELTAMKDRARRDIDAAKRQAIDELYAEASTLAAVMARKILGREVRVEDTKRLLQESLVELEASGR